jgi:hypothetical protein
VKLDSLKNCIAVLEQLLDATDSQLDTGVRSELVAVIAELTRISESQRNNVELGTLGLRALEAIAQIISLVTNLTNLMK